MANLSEYRIQIIGLEELKSKADEIQKLFKEIQEIEITAKLIRDNA